MPLLPSPLGAGVAGGPLPVSSQADVNAVLPLFLQPEDPAPVRDAIFAALTQILLRYQQRAAFAAGQADILTATGTYLAQACADIGVYKQAGETDLALRTRALTSPSIVTPVAILAAANAILAPFTSILARYSEPLSDRWFIRSGSTGYPRGYVYQITRTPLSPDDPSRFYQSEAVLNGGAFIQGREPGAARIYSDSIGREFLLRVPDLSSITATIQPIYQGATTPIEILARSTYGTFVGNGTSPSNTDYVRLNPASATTLYGAIINAVNRIKGASIRWIFLADPNLLS